MTTPEQSLAEQPASNDSTPDNNLSSYTEIFCRALTQLNAVSIEQIEGLLNIAVKAAEKVHSINASAAAPPDEKLTEFVNEMKNTAARMSQTNQTAANVSSPPAINPEAFPALVEQTLGNAIHNSANNQQELNIIGAAILTQAAALLLSSGGSKPVEGE